MHHGLRGGWTPLTNSFIIIINCQGLFSVYNDCAFLYLCILITLKISKSQVHLNIY